LSNRRKQLDLESRSEARKAIQELKAQTFLPDEPYRTYYERVSHQGGFFSGCFKRILTITLKGGVKCILLVISGTDSEGKRVWFPHWADIIYPELEKEAPSGRVMVPIVVLERVYVKGMPDKKFIWVPRTSSYKDVSILEYWGMYLPENRQNTICKLIGYNLKESIWKNSVDKWLE